MAERRPKPRTTKAERRRLLLEQARRLFARQGFAATTLEQVAEAAGLTLAALSKQFSDPSTLVAGIVEEFHDRLVGAAAAVDRSQAKLAAMLDAFLRDFGAEQSPARVLLQLLAQGEPEARSAIAAALAPTGMAIADLIRAGQQEGVFRRALDPPQAAWEVLRSMFGQALLADVEPPAPPDAEHPDPQPMGFDVLLHGLLKTDV